MNEPALGEIIRRIQRITPTLGGVFSYGDLFNVIGFPVQIKNKRMIKRLTREKILYRVQRGIYVTSDPNLAILATRLKPAAYISMDSTLVANGLIGTMPLHALSAVAPAIRPRVIKTPFGSIRFFSIKRDLVFGVTSLTNGVRTADNEKAYLDLLYFHTKGARFAIDPRNDVHVSKLDRKKLAHYLKRYRNPRFIKFVQDLVK